MSSFIPEKQHMREVLIYFFNLRKSAYESHRLLVEAYGEHALSKATCERWFNRFKSGDFDVKDKERPGQPKKFEDPELLVLLDHDPCQTLEELAGTLNVGISTVSRHLHKLGMVQKLGKWVPHKLTERSIEKRKDG